MLLLYSLQKQIPSSISRNEHVQVTASTPTGHSSNDTTTSTTNQAHGGEEILLQISPKDSFRYTTLGQITSPRVSRTATNHSAGEDSSLRDRMEHGTIWDMTQSAFDHSSDWFSLHSLEQESQDSWVLHLIHSGSCSCDEAAKHDREQKEGSSTQIDGTIMRVAKAMVELQSTGVEETAPLYEALNLMKSYFEDKCAPPLSEALDINSGSRDYTKGTNCKEAEQCRLWRQMIVAQFQLSNPDKSAKQVRVVPLSILLEHVNFCCITQKRKKDAVVLIDTPLRRSARNVRIRSMNSPEIDKTIPIFHSPVRAKGKSPSDDENNRSSKKRRKKAVPLDAPSQAHLVRDGLFTYGPLDDFPSYAIPDQCILCSCRDRPHMVTNIDYWCEQHQKRHLASSKVSWRELFGYGCGWELIEVPSNGDCFFNCINKALEITFAYSSDNVSPELLRQRLTSVSIQEMRRWWSESITSDYVTNLCAVFAAASDEDQDSGFTPLRKAYENAVSNNQHYEGSYTKE